MAKKSAVPIGTPKSSRRYFVGNRPVESEAHKAARHRAFAANQILYDEAIKYFRQELGEESGLAGLLVLRVGNRHMGLLQGMPPSYMLDAIRDVVGEEKTSAFVGYLSDKFDSFLSIMLDFGVSSDDLLHSALTTQFGLSSEDAVAARSKIEDIVTSIRSVPNPPLTLPEAPPAYKYGPRMDGGIVKYLRDNWEPYIRAGIMSRPDLNRVDPPAYQALRNWLKNPANVLPEELYLPTITEQTDRMLALRGLGDLSGREAAKLASAAVRRAHKDPAPK